MKPMYPGAMLHPPYSYVNFTSDIWMQAERQKRDDLLRPGKFNQMFKSSQVKQKPEFPCIPCSGHAGRAIADPQPW